MTAAPGLTLAKSALERRRRVDNSATDLDVGHRDVGQRDVAGVGHRQRTEAEVAVTETPAESLAVTVAVSTTVPLST